MKFTPTLEKCEDRISQSGIPTFQSTAAIVGHPTAAPVYIGDIATSVYGQSVIFSASVVTSGYSAVKVQVYVYDTLGKLVGSPSTIVQVPPLGGDLTGSVTLGKLPTGPYNVVIKMSDANYPGKPPVTAVQPIIVAHQVPIATFIHVNPIGDQYCYVC
jgi:hypothetical protein